MAFKIEKLTEEQKKEISSWKLKEPVLGLRRIIREEELTAPLVLFQSSANGLELMWKLKLIDESLENEQLFYK